MQPIDELFESLYTDSKIRNYVKYMALCNISKQNYGELEDIVAEFWVHFYSAIAKFEGRNGAKITTFLYIVCRRFFLNFSRSMRGKNKVFLDNCGIKIDISDGGINAKKQFEDISNGDLAELLLKRLPVKDARILKADILDKIPYQITCKKEKISKTNYFLKLNRAKKEFAKRISAEELRE